MVGGIINSHLCSYRYNVTFSALPTWCESCLHSHNNTIGNYMLERIAFLSLKQLIAVSGL